MEEKGELSIAKFNQRVKLAEHLGLDPTYTIIEYLGR
jgi:hypothetical protein